MIGVFDSGVGGLGILTQIRHRLPTADITYVADQEWAPYGTRTLDQVARAADGVTSWLLGRGADTIVVACNTASAAALNRLRHDHPNTPFVGMEPAVKPAALTSTSGVIGVLATEATFQGELFSSVVRRHAPDTRVITAACPEWVQFVELGETDGKDVRALVAERIAPMLGEGADCLVLGCTHFPYLEATIRYVAGPDVSIMDPASAVARQVERVSGSNSGRGTITLATSGDPGAFGERARQLAGIETTVLALSGHGRSHLL